MDTDKPPDSGPKIYGEVCLRKQRRKRQKLLIIELLYDYAQNSTLHGLRYMVDRGLLMFEKLFWLLTFLMSVGMCFYLISNVWIKWKTSPVIVSFSERIVSVGDVPFPSITICPQLKSKARVFDYSEGYKQFLEAIKEENFDQQSFIDGKWDKLEDIQMVCSANTDNTIVKTGRNITDGSIIQHFYEVSPTVDDTILYCEWRGNPFECKNAFKSVVTNEGICYNFNALAAHEILRLENLQNNFTYLNTSRPRQDWSIENGYSDFRPNETYPRRGRENNAYPQLVVILQESPMDRDGLCNSIKSGYTIYVQHPADLPQSSLYYYAALPGQVSSLALKFSMETTDECLKGYSPDVRQCYFPEDRQLRYFSIYTPNNCKLECQSNYTFARCNCVWFHMPHNDSRQICIGDENTSCMVDALDRLTLAELNTKHKVVGTRPCHCLPSCNNIRYDAEILKTNFNVRTYLENQEKIMQASQSIYTSKNLSQIEVYFKHSQFISVRRSELFGITDFMANCGGLLGLFLGFSFLSLVEIFYFATIRIFTILRRDLRDEKKNRAKEKQEENN